MIKADMHMQVHMQQDGMKLRKFLIVIIVMLLFTNCVRFIIPFENCKADTPPTLYVGPGETYTHIQDAIDNATDGYRIFVYNGTYYENLIINYRIDLFGEDRSITIINGNGTDTTITVNANNVNISHFTITNNGSTRHGSNIQVNRGNSIITDNIISHGYHGVYLNNSNGHLIYDNIIEENTDDGIRLNQSDSNTNISYNTIKGNGNGLYLYSSEGNKIYNNVIQYNDANGVFLNSTCNDNYIVNNNCSYNNHSGIYVNDYSDYSTISNNQINGNNDSGLVLENCSWAIIANGNTIRRNTNYGIMIIGSSNTIQRNTIAYNKKDGMYFSADDNNTISSNSIGFNTLTGIRLYNSTADYIYSNEINNNNQYGIYLDFFTIDNSIYNNYLHDNTVNAADKSLRRNSWNITKTDGFNIIGGSNLSGNYWDNYDEISEDATDNDGDGIADDPYTIYASNTDNGPLLDTIKPHIETLQESPSSQTLGKYTNISVTITDNTKIKGVYLNITNPNGQRSNFSIVQNKTGNTYYCNKRFSPTGNYTYHITVKDPRNWNHSVNRTFSIHPGDPPTIKDNSPTSGAPSVNFTFNATVTSKDAVASDLQVYVVWSHGNILNNSTMAISHGNYFVKTVVLAHSITNLTYHFYATDKWGNHAVLENKKVKITDTRRPVIRINRYGPSFEDLPNSYTFGVTVTDDSIVSNVTIEYWYNNSNKMTANMDSMGNNYYKKVIVPEGSPEKVFCVMNATDVAGNTNDTKKPVACHGGPYSGFVLEQIRFNGSRSYDLDGTISRYDWNFGDGTRGNGSRPTHTYYSNGSYTVSLTVTDNEGKNRTNRTSIYIITLAMHKIPAPQLTLLNDRYNLTISEQFSCYDSDGNGVVDTFVDPNHILTAVHNRPVTLSDNICFLLSIGDDLVPEFFWNTTTDRIFSIGHTIGIVQNMEVDDANEQAIMYVTVDKEQWIYIEVNDQYPNSPVLITTNNRIISSDKFWRENQKIYVFDDPETEYQFTFNNIFPTLTVTFSPPDGGVINGDNPTIKITHNVPVTIISATFNSITIESNLLNLDDKNYTYTPSGYLENGTYLLEINAQALQGKGFLASSAMYFYFAYEIPPQKSFLEKNWLGMVLGGCIGAMGGLLIFFRLKNVSIDGFIYMKNRKIVPFFKSIIVGPVSVRIPDEHLSKAEFYVDGVLKDETTTFPALWQWNEKAFMKHTLETKVYDVDGNSASSGEMEFYIFNLSKSKEN
jgi:parallel beta-helix repeat protein